MSSDAIQLQTALERYREKYGKKVADRLFSETLEESADPTVLRAARRLADKRSGIKGMGLIGSLEVLAAIGRLFVEKGYNGEGES